MFNLWKPLVPHGVHATWAPVKEAGRMAWYFNDNYPWLGMLFCAPIIGLWYRCTDKYIVHRVLGAPGEQEARRGAVAAAFFKLTPRVAFHHSGHHRLRPGQKREGGGDAARAVRRLRKHHSRQRAEGLPAPRGARAASGRARRGGRGPARRPHELPGRRVQRVVDPCSRWTSTPGSGAACLRNTWCGWGASPPPPWWLSALRGSR